MPENHPDWVSAAFVAKKARNADLLSIFVFIKFDERILQGVTRLLVSNDLAAHDLPEPRKDEVEILVPRHRVELAYEEHVLRWSDVRKWKVSDHFERQCGCRRCLFATLLLLLFFGESMEWILVFRNARCVVRRLSRRRVWNNETRWVVKRIIWEKSEL